ncbi:MAG: hypothetical protein HC831_15670 [Chloroflexia bacterium]|nr:hypothetical protein [Chloroflexia bacterium]
MADTHWEKTIDEMVDKNTDVYLSVFSNENQVIPAGDTLVRDHDYLMRFYVKNKGSEVRFTKLQARLTLKKISNVVLFTDDTYSVNASRIVLNWTDVGAGEWRSGVAYFRVTKDMKDANIVHYGLYAVVEPEGHHWGTLNWDKNTGPQ